MRYRHTAQNQQILHTLTLSSRVSGEVLETKTVKATYVRREIRTLTDAAREAFLQATSTVIPKHKCKGEGCSHCWSNRDMVCRRLKCLDSKGKKLPKKDLEGTLWGTPPARPLGVAPSPTVDVSKRREPPALTKRLEKVEVLGGRGPKRQAAGPKGSTSAKKVAEKARARDTEEKRERRARERSAEEKRRGADDSGARV